MSRLKNYLPAAGLMLMAWVFLAVPMLAAFIVSSVLILFAVLYAWTVRQLHRSQDRMQYRRPSQPGERTYRDVNEPSSFRDVTVTILKDRGFTSP